ncbi:hypothetical protein LOTGIDRAFT_162342 [Lottia gigantea]|uniref:Uncharacterized protein n=1 Tax=Lottia gigantea TaxID=225164 RepID=V4ACR0_LOTGI|nr:hypothetical protein LOTGIDRAFT_162342 [Lottia gigantea]ESO92865.1 hypothetical protein LOTGIDRAFT_162342 [Lottia gigantea]
MSKKYMSRPPYCFGYLPDYSIPPMTVEEYQYYDNKFFGFLNEKPLHKAAEDVADFVENFIQFIGISKLSKYEDEFPQIKFNVHHVLQQNAYRNASNPGVEAGDSFRSGGTSLTRVSQEKKATHLDVVNCNQEVQTIKTPKSRRFLRSFKCMKTVE